MKKFDERALEAICDINDEELKNITAAGSGVNIADLNYYSLQLFRRKDLKR